MLVVFSIMIVGIVAGYFLRRVPELTFLPRFISIFIFLLLFFLGISVGKNPQIMNNLLSIGGQALIITAGALAGSLALAWLVYKKFFEQ